jgi:hypothetical protein
MGEGDPGFRVEDGQPDGVFWAPGQVGIVFPSAAYYTRKPGRKKGRGFLARELLKSFSTRTSGNLSRSKAEMEDHRPPVGEESG